MISLNPPHAVAAKPPIRVGATAAQRPTPPGIQPPGPHPQQRLNPARSADRLHPPAPPAPPTVSSTVRSGTRSKARGAGPAGRETSLERVRGRGQLGAADGLEDAPPLNEGGGEAVHVARRQVLGVLLLLPPPPPSVTAVVKRGCTPPPAQGNEETGYDMPAMASHERRARTSGLLPPQRRRRGRAPP